MIRKVEIDGNDGTGKSYRIEKMKELFPGLVYYDRGIFFILDASPATCQRRIKERGDSLEEEYHTKEDLLKYSERFYELCEICDDLPNVMWVCTTEW